MSKNTNHDLLISFQNLIDYEFKNKELLKTSLTHSSYANERKKSSIDYNERLEFLGDSILGMVISDYIFKKCPKKSEGELTKIRAIIVCEKALSLSATSINLGKYLYLGKGEEQTGGRNRNSILADAFESVIGAIYLDGGIEEASRFTMVNLNEVIEKAILEQDIFKDYKTEFQEILQKDNKEKIEYKLVKSKGPDHNKIFHTEVHVGNEVYGKGYGKSKKESEQSAAKTALDRMEKNE